MNVGSLVASPSRARAAEGAVSVSRGFLWVLPGYLSYMLCQWGMFVVLARCGSPEKVGQFALALATTAPIILFTMMGLRRVCATDARSMFRYADYLGLRLVTNLAALGMIALVVWTAGYGAKTVIVVLAMGLAKAIEAISDMHYGLFQRVGRIDLVARSLFIRGPLALAGLAAGFLATKDVLWGVVGMGAGWLATLLFFDWPWARRFSDVSRADADAGRASSAASPRAWGLLARLALPLGLVALLGALKASIPSLVIEKYLGVGALGFFAAVFYFYGASNRIVNGLGEAGATRLATQYADGEVDEFARLVARMLVVALAIGLAGLGVALLAGKALMIFFYGADYGSMSEILVVIMAAACAANVQTILDVAMSAARHFRIQPFLYGAGALVLLLLCGALIPSDGLRGAGIALGAASIFEMFAAAIVVGWALSRRRAARGQPAMEGS